MTGFTTPPGRAGRLRLRHSLAVATRGAELLDQKLRVLRGEQQRLQAAAETAAEIWGQRVAEAERWLLRGLALSGESALDAATGGDTADVAVERTVIMGVRLPVAGPVRFPGGSAPPNTALVRAQDAYRDALRAAADHAAASAAVRLVDAEVLRTRQRVRALHHHWIPRLEQDLATLELALEQAEHEDAVRRRWITGYR